MRLVQFKYQKYQEKRISDRFKIKKIIIKKK